MTDSVHSGSGDRGSVRWSSDRELLEPAAKAVGIDLQFGENDYPHTMLGGLSMYWNPLTDDGDALRLAVAAKVDLQQGHWVTATVWLERSDTHFFSPKEKREEFGEDPAAATRRAIVRAAAEVGKAMP